MYFQRHHFETILILSLYIYHFSTVIDFSSEKYSGSTGHRNSWYQQRNLQQQLLSCITQWLEHWVCNPGVASSSLTIGILTVNFSTGTRSFCVQQNHCTSRMRSQSQLTNDKYIMMQYTNWINSTHSQQQLLSCIAQWLEHWVCNPGVASSSLTIGNFNFFSMFVIWNIKYQNAASAPTSLTFSFGQHCWDYSAQLTYLYHPALICWLQSQL